MARHGECKTEGERRGGVRGCNSKETWEMEMERSSSGKINGRSRLETLETAAWVCKEKDCSKRVKKRCD